MRAGRPRGEAPRCHAGHEEVGRRRGSADGGFESGGVIGFVAWKKVGEREGMERTRRCTCFMSTARETDAKSAVSIDVKDERKALTTTPPFM